VHHVHVDPLGPPRLHLGHLLGEAAEVGAEHARGDANGHGCPPSPTFRSTGASAGTRAPAPGRCPETIPPGADGGDTVPTRSPAASILYRAASSVIPRTAGTIRSAGPRLTTSVTASPGIR